MFPWGDHRRINAHSLRLKERFGMRVQKLSVDAGFSCPNRDGSRGRGGCTFCDNNAFNPSYCVPEKSIRQQLEEGIAFHRLRYRRTSAYLAYFQAYSNTYGPLDVLQQRYSEALSVDGVMGLVIGTRPDCVGEEVLELLAKLALQYPVFLELGLESCCDRTLMRINRGHSFAEAEDAIRRAAGRGLEPAIHLMLGLPGESREEMIASADIISSLPVRSLKLHQLQIIKGTVMEKEWMQMPGDFTIFGLDEYIDLVIRFLERLRPDIAIERLAAEAPPRYLAERRWGGLRYDQILRRIEDEMERRDTWQGRGVCLRQTVASLPSADSG